MESQGHKILHALVIFAIMFVGISPACAFISGNSSFIQICAADGSVQTIEVDASLDPFFEPAPISTDHLDAMEKCSFCFASSHQKYNDVRSYVIAFDAAPRYLRVSGGVFVPVGSETSLYQPRGPPQLS